MGKSGFAEPRSSGDYLNNRYHDPSTGLFLSVDPLVATTGQPYLYGGGNPTTNSDVTGLCWRNNGRQGADDGTGACPNGSGAHAAAELTPKQEASAQANARGRVLFASMFGGIQGHHNWPMFLGGPEAQTKTGLEAGVHRAAHDYIAKRIEEDFGFKPRGPGMTGQRVRDAIDAQAKTTDYESERQEWIRGVINEDGFADAVGDEEAEVVRDNFDHDFPKLEYSTDGDLCACDGWYPVGDLPAGHHVVPPGTPIVPLPPLGPLPIPGGPVFVPSPVLV